MVKTYKKHEETPFIRVEEKVSKKKVFKKKVFKKKIISAAVFKATLQTLKAQIILS
jgi:hypothetical protein